ncbi:MAG: DUF3592 domain-containing protein, partial [Armatimonadetes bacterium]|nr:DUF3592 domain-containing protein [Anaerolineae bacterium]
AALGLNSVLQAQRLEREGVTTTGEFVSRATTTDSDSNTNYSVEYAFTMDGVRYTRTESVNEPYYNQAESGGAVQLRYLPSDPTVSAIVGNSSSDTAGFIIFGVIWAGLLVLIVTGTTLNLRRQERLTRDGKLVLGTVVQFTSKVRGEDQDVWLELTYRFQHTESGETITGTDRWKRNDLKGTALPTPGTAVAVLYTDAKQHMVL